MAVLASGLVTLAQTGTGAAIFLGDAILSALHVRPPDWYSLTFRENKLQTGAMAWFVGSTVQQNLLATGAFEISYDGVLVFSKTLAGRLPSIPEILAGIEDVRESHRNADREDGERAKAPNMATSLGAEDARVTEL